MKIHLILTLLGMIRLWKFRLAKVMLFKGGHTPRHSGYEDVATKDLTNGTDMKSG